MTINAIFLIFITIVGAAAGFVLVAMPEARNLRISPYFWVLIGMAIFEVLAYAHGRGAAGTTLQTEYRLLGFVVAVVLMVLIPFLADSPGRLF
jgi:hypothetical protein